MSPVGVFFQEHYKVMLIGLSITLIGIFLNWLVGKQTNKTLLAKLTSELESLRSKPSLTSDEQYGELPERRNLHPEIQMLI